MDLRHESLLDSRRLWPKPYATFRSAHRERIFFYWCYTEVLAKLMAKAPDIEKYKQAVRMLALGNTVPFVGPLTIDSKVKEFLFAPAAIVPTHSFRRTAINGWW
jgi:hypothetical protein